MTKLTREIAEKFAGLALAHVRREYPNIIQHTLASEADIGSPRALHPIFFGSYDWHSCVHGYWLLARLMRRYPEFSAAAAIAALLDESITAENVAGECAYLEHPMRRAYERPYGWAWLLALQHELDQHEQGAGQRAAKILRPLADLFVRRFAAFLPISTYPVRTGVHTSTSFALRLAADYVEANEPDLHALMRDKILGWHRDDRDAQAWEPSQDDFLSPTLMTAEAMRRYMTRDAFRIWFSAYLPRVAQGEPASLFTLARATDRSDGKIAHLDGLNFARAWCWRSIASTLDDELVIAAAHKAADAHIAASLPHVAGDYMGEHWLATFAVLALEA